MGALQPFIEHRRKQGKKSRTINYGIQTARHILNLAASEWLDEEGRPWLEHAPRLKFLPETDRRVPYPLSYEEQERLFAELPEHLRRMCLFKVNRGPVKPRYAACAGNGRNLFPRSTRRFS